MPYGDLIPLAVAIALSPFPIVPVVLLLLTDRPRSNGGSYLLGWYGGLVMGTGVAAAAATAVDLWEETPTWAAWVRIVLGVALVLLSVKKFIRRGQAEAPPAWMAAISSYSPGRALRLGALLALANPKALLLAIAAGLAIGTAGLGLAASAGVVLGFLALAAITVAAPVLAHVVLGERITRPLGRAKEWLVTHNDAVVAVVLTAIGIMLIVKGAGTL